MGERMRRADRAVTLAVIALVAVACTLCIAYVSILRQSVRAENERYLSEISQHAAALVDQRVDDTFQALDTAAANWNITGSEERSFLRLDSMARIYGYDRIAVIAPDGMAQTSDGLTRDLSAVPAVQDALAGEHRVCRVLLPEEEGGDVTLYVVPMVQDGRVIGAVSATTGTDQLRQLLSVESFGGEGYAQIVDAQGDFVVDSLHPNAYQGGGNFHTIVEADGALGAGYSAEKIYADMAQGRSGTFQVTVEGREKFASYVKLGTEDWYLLSMVPTAVATEGSRRLIQLAVLINALIVGLFLALTVLVLRRNKRSRRTLEEIALVDPVTGGMNRTCFEREAGAAIQRAPRGTWMVLSLDIRHFKLINDAFGSDMGNRTLKYVHDTVLRRLEKGELVGRITGDQFSVLLRSRPEPLAAAWLEQVAYDINSFNEGRERQYYLSISGGVYRVDEPELDMITIQDRANVARKKDAAPLAGRLAACGFYSDADRRRLLREKEIEDRKESALAGREFVVYLQPKILLSDRSVAGAEALVRWQDPERGLVPPDEFVPVFERSGFITRVDLYVFEEVCALLRRWLDGGLTPVPVAVNLSRVHLREASFLREYQAVADRYRVPASLIEFEFTETMAGESPEELAAVVERLHALGFRCALDDFGSGSSSLNILKDVPVDVLKLDRAFFGGSGLADRRGRGVVESAVDLARRLDMQTVAEGVETEQQVDFLRQAGCDMVQGFFFSRPVPVAEFERMAFPGAAETGKEAGVP